MLDADTKHRIDAARNILVGKVPDPKSQVEQITLALIYKFMDDMDAESELLGGVRSFFVANYEKYGWAKLMNSGLGGNEILNRYAEAMNLLPRHQGLPQLFREIFKNAYLPYRDPETLKLFLKQIDGFTYDHSERLGDAFEYLLSVLGTQGDAGQFRTPRHIIDFMVALLDPQKTETVLDPACGTAGFLIAAYKHIAKANTDAQGASSLSQAERVKLANNFIGYDISPDMVRLSRVNLYLHGFATPRIDEYDTLTQLDHWGKTVDVILANPPFMSPKGGIQTHSKFSVQSKRSEVLFVDYMAEHLSPRGRAAIIVPEGIIFQSGSAYKQLRKMLVEQYLVAVISLPAGLFQPYSGVKTSILVLDRALAPTAMHVAFFTIANDGFALNAQRRPIAANDLPQVLADCKAWMQSLAAGKPTDTVRPEPVEGLDINKQGLRHAQSERMGATPTPLHVVDKTKLAASGDYNLSGERYRADTARSEAYPWATLGEVCDIFNGSTPSKQDASFWESGNVPWFTVEDIRVQGRVIRHTQQKTTALALQKTSIKLLPKNTVLLCCTASVGEYAFSEIELTTNQQFNGLVIKRDYQDLLLPKYLFFLSSLFKEKLIQLSGKTSFNFVSVATLKTVQIPLPPLAIQQAIVAEIERYQTIIDGARAVVNNYQPQIDIDPSWEVVELQEVCDVRDGTHESPKYVTENGFPLVTSKNLKNGFIDFNDVNLISKADLDLINLRSKVDDGDLLMPMIGSIGKPIIANYSRDYAVKNVAIIKFNKTSVLNNYFLNVFLSSETAENMMKVQASGSTQKFISLGYVRKIKIPLPPLATQHAIVAQIQAEQALVNANRELITRFEAKIAATLARVWGDAAQ